MNGRQRRDAFTLIEVLIVVVIMAVLAATIVPQFASSSKDAQESSLKFNLHTLRSQIELFKQQHSGIFPAATELVDKLTMKTDGTGALDPTGRFGPYLHEMPANPINGLKDVKATTGTDPATVTPDDSTGYLYNATTGQIWANKTGNDGAGVPFDTY